MWNADFFAEQQASVSFLIDEKPNPFKNIKSLPVAGNISTPEEKIDSNEFGSVKDFEIFEGVIRSHLRMTYEELKKILVDKGIVD